MRYRTKYIAIAVLLCGCFMAQGKKNPQGVTLRELGYVDSAAVTYYYTTGIVREMVDGDLEEAMHMYAEAINLDSLFAPAYYQTATILAAMDVPEAIRYSRRANDIDSANVWYKAQLGRLLIMADQYEEALGIYSQLIRIAPGNPDNYRLLAALHDETGQSFAAIAILDSAEFKLGRTEELSAFKRDLLMKVKLYDKAIEETKALIRDYPYKPENYVFLGKVYGTMHRDSLARANFERALELAPGDAAVLSELNDYYRRSGDVFNFLVTAKTLFLSDDVPMQNKISFYEDLARDRDFYRDNFFQMKDLAGTLLLKYPGQDEVLDIYARTMYATGNVEQAAAFYKGHLSDTASINVYNNILDIESYLKRPDSVVLYARKALERYPENTDIYARLSSSMVSMEDYGSALKVLRTGLKHAATDSVRSVFYGMIGDIYYTQQNKKESYANYTKALRYWEGNVLVMNNYAYYLSEEGKQLEKALEMSERVNALSPGVASYLDTQGWILYKLGRYDEAKKLVQQAISLHRSDSDVLYLHYGDILYELGDRFMAAFYWRKAQDSGADEAEVELRLKLVEDK